MESDIQAGRNHVRRLQLLPEAKVRVILTSQLKTRGRAHVLENAVRCAAPSVSGIESNKVAKLNRLHARVAGVVVIPQQIVGQSVDDAGAAVVGGRRRRDQPTARVDRRGFFRPHADIAIRRDCASRLRVINERCGFERRIVRRQHTAGAHASRVEQGGRSTGGLVAHGSKHVRALVRVHDHVTGRVNHRIANRCRHDRWLLRADLRTQQTVDRVDQHVFRQVADRVERQSQPDCHLAR